MNELEIPSFFAAHAADFQDAAPTPRERSLPRHRARTRPHWRPTLEAVQAQHADHGDTFVR